MSTSVFNQFNCAKSPEAHTISGYFVKKITKPLASHQTPDYVGSEQPTVVGFNANKLRNRV